MSVEDHPRTRYALPMTADGMLSLEAAQSRIVDALRPLCPETVDLLSACGRISATNIVAHRSLPAFANSAMDGYAVRAVDTAGAPVRLRLQGRVAAGQVPKEPLRPEHAMRLFTGAPLPEGADAVVMQEDTEPHEDHVLVRREAAVKQHVRAAGEDMVRGMTLVPAGGCLGAGELGALASQGLSWVEVVRRPRVAIVATGDELVECDAAPGPGAIVNSNSYLLAAQIAQAGGIPVRLPPAADKAQALAETFEAAARAADIVISCGGVSVGDFDLVRPVLASMGQIDFWKVAIKPGKPLAYGTVHGRPFMGLPGNPASAFVCFELFARPALRRLGGRTPCTRPSLPAHLTAPVQAHPTRRHLMRASLRRDAEGSLWATPHPTQGSGQQSSLLGVDALLDVPAQQGSFAAKSVLPVFVLNPELP